MMARQMIGGRSLCVGCGRLFGATLMCLEREIMLRISAMITQAFRR